MKITDVTLTLFAWEGIPATTYNLHTGTFQGKSQLGLVRIVTDEGSRATRSSARRCSRPIRTGRR